MRKVYTFIALLILSGCTSGIPLKSVDYSHVLSDENSKVWVIEKEIVNGVNISSGLTSQKDLIIFHNSGRVQIIAMKALGHTRPKSGYYHLNSQEMNLGISFKHEEWNMELVYVTEDSVYFKPKSNSDYKHELQIKPLPEL
jgi:hypothetical protein